jgi:CRISPR-associated protein Cas2
MAEPKHYYLICYDIRDPKRWRKAYKLLKGYGETLQYSIVRVRLNQRGTGTIALEAGANFDRRR